MLHMRQLTGCLCVLTLACGGCETLLDGLCIGGEGDCGLDPALARVYGDGSAGARVIDHDQELRSGGVGDINYQYTDFTIDHGVTLTVQSGCVIRCTGRFINYGTVFVKTGAEGGRNGNYGTSTDGASQAPPIGLTTRAAGNAAIGGSSTAKAAGFGGDGISEFEARVTLRLAVAAGGGGGAAMAEGGQGGGAFTVLALEGVMNAGDVMANGGGGDAGDDHATGDGGGGGGFVVLASATEVMNAAGAMIMAEGGDGAAAGSESGPGGGGGGGVVHLLAPTVVDDGDVSVEGGDAGPGGPAASVTAAVRAGGGGGGAGGGNGGDGGMVTSGAMADPGDAEAGAAGISIVTTADPTALF